MNLEQIDIHGLIIRNTEALKSYLSGNNITAYRLISNSPALPLAVDIYQGNAVIHVYDFVLSVIFEELERQLKAILNIESFFYKNNSKEELALPVHPPKKIVQEEYGNRFLVNLSDYLDTGLFLDHRETRKWIAGQSRDKDVLNTFAYTGSFTIYAAKAGAAKTYSVDISNVYCEWIKENLTLNCLSPDNNFVYKMDTFEFLKYAKKKDLSFDVIIIDPPTFSNYKGKAFSVREDHPALINAALELLSAGGFILFSNNYTEFRLKTKDLSPRAVIEKLDTVPPDFTGTTPHRCFIIRK
jgi:23S rRNA G2069 N7-methylase RlmK/C1962 C5-methylase RlmI